MRRPLSVLGSFGCLLAVPAAALAQDAPPAPSQPPATGQPAPKPEPAPGRMSVVLEKVNGRSGAVLAGDRFRVRGRVTPYLPGQRVLVRLRREGRVVSERRVEIRRAGRGDRGGFVLGLSSGSPGRVEVSAVHEATAEQARMTARSRTLEVLPRRIRPGARGLGVRLVQRRMAKLGYVVGEAGVFDARTARAVLAFRKVLRMERTTEADAEMLRRLARGEGGFRVRYPHHGKHVEADLSRQVLALIRGSKVERIYHTSSGAPATPTVRGSYRFYLKTPGTNAKGMVYSAYFIRGYAIHGYASVPTHPASHGCLRVPIPDAIPIYNWLSIGDRIDVYM